MYNKKQNVKTKHQKKSTVIRRSVEFGFSENANFDMDNMIDFLSNIPFDMININLSAEKKVLGLNGRGVSPIGFVNDFYQTEDGIFQFDVVIFDKFEKLFNDMRMPLITVRAFVNRDGEISKITNLVLEDGVAVEEEEEFEDIPEVTE